jgi:activator of HSP90 ATPase
VNDLQFYCDVYVEREVVFAAWTDSWKQGEITQALAKVHPIVEGQFELWNGAVKGQFLNIKKPKQLKMTWRTIDFESWMPSTQLTVDFQSRPNGCRVVITHEQIPSPLIEQFRFAWEQVYLPQMQMYFTRIKNG